MTEEINDMTDETTTDTTTSKPKQKKTPKRFVSSRDIPGYVVIHQAVTIDKPMADRMKDAGLSTEKSIVKLLSGYYGNPDEVDQDDRPKGWVPFPVGRLLKSATRDLAQVAKANRIDELRAAAKELAAELAALEEEK